MSRPLMDAGAGKERRSGFAIQPWAPYELQFTGLGSQKLSIAGTQAREIAITADLLGLDVHLKDGLEADRFGFTLTHGAIDDSRIGKTLVEGLTADGRFPAPPPTDATRSSLDLIAHLSRLTLPPGVDAPLGREIYSAHLVAQVMGPIPPGPPREALPAWSGAGGDVELREVQLLWGGLWLKGDATLAFDKALQPLFAGSFAIANIGSLLDKLVTAGVLPGGNRPRGEDHVRGAGHHPAGGRPAPGQAAAHHPGRHALHGPDQAGRTPPARLELAAVTERLSLPSFPRKRESRATCEYPRPWIPAFAGMTEVGDSLGSDRGLATQLIRKFSNCQGSFQSRPGSGNSTPRPLSGVQSVRTPTTGPR